MRVVRDDLWLCQDCLFAAVNGDFSGLDGTYSKEASERRYQEIVAGLKKLGPHLVPDFDSEAGKGIEDFSRRTCDCCGTRLAGDRHRFAVLGE